MYERCTKRREWEKPTKKSESFRIENVQYLTRKTKELPKCRPVTIYIDIYHIHIYIHIYMIYILTEMVSLSFVRVFAFVDKFLRERFFCFIVNLCNFQLSPSVKVKELYYIKQRMNVSRIFESFVIKMRPKFMTRPKVWLKTWKYDDVNSKHRHIILYDYYADDELYL